MLEALFKLDEMPECESCKEYDKCGRKKDMCKKKKDAVNTIHIDIMDDTEKWLNGETQTTPEGFLTGRSVVTNIGVFPYRQPDGSIQWELRPPEEVLKDESLETLKLKVISNEHPKEKITVDNVKKYQIGFMGSNITTDPYAVSINWTITDPDSISQVKTKQKMAWSCGYDCEMDYTPGVWMGVPYNAVQRNIKYNHLALVPKGRAGDLAKIKIDNAIIQDYDVTTKETGNIQNIQKEDNVSMKVVKIDGVEYQAEAEVIKSLNQAKADSEAASKKLEESKADFSKIEAERDSLREKVDSLTKEIEAIKADKADEAKINELVKAKLFLLDSAKKAEIEIKDDMNDLEIKKAIILKVNPSAKLDGKDEIYINARFDASIEDLEAKISSKKDQDKDVKIKGADIPKEDKADAKVFDADDAKVAYLKKLKGEK